MHKCKLFELKNFNLLIFLAVVIGFNYNNVNIVPPNRRVSFFFITLIKNFLSNLFIYFQEEKSCDSCTLSYKKNKTHSHRLQSYSTQY